VAARAAALVVGVILVLWPWLAHEHLLRANAADLPEWLLRGEASAWWIKRVALGSLCLLPLSLPWPRRGWRYAVYVPALAAAAACLAWPSPADRALWQALDLLLNQHSDQANGLLIGWAARRAAAAAVVLLPVFMTRAQRGKMLAVQAAVLALAAAGAWWPGLEPQARLALRLVGLLTLGLVLLAWLLPRRAWSAFLGAALAASLFLCVPLFDGSMAWYTIGIKYGTRHWKQLFRCRAANLGAILQSNYRWHFADTLDLAGFLPLVKGPWIVEVRSLMIAGYTLALFLCALGAARHYRRHDRQFLAAVLAPWVVMFAILPQMVDRYAMWPAAVAAAVAAVSFSGVLLYLALNAMAVVMMANFLFVMSPHAPLAKYWIRVTLPTDPGLGWGWVALAGVALGMALRSTRPAGGGPEAGG
jgi:hypothetical protein